MRRGERWLLGIAIALAAAGVLSMALQSRQARLAADFTLDYAAGVLLREGQFAAPYQQQVLVATIHRVAPASSIDPRLPYNKPLAAALPAALLSLLPLDIAFRVWQLLSVALMVGAIVVLQQAAPLGRGALRFGSVGLFAAVPAWASLTEGQITPLVLMGASLIVLAALHDESALRAGPSPPDGYRQRQLGSGTATPRRLALWAAFAGALLAVKPQYVPACLLILVAARLWRALFAAFIGSALVMMSPLAGGGSALAAMVHNAFLANQAVSIHADETWTGLLGSLMPPPQATVAGTALFAAILLALSWLAWRRSLEPVVFATLAGVLSLLASPHALPHDLLLLAVPAWLSVSLDRERRLPVNPVVAWLLVDLALVVDLRGVGLPLAPVVLTVLIVLSLVEIRRRAARKEHHPPVALAG